MTFSTLSNRCVFLSCAISLFLLFPSQVGGSSINQVDSSGDAINELVGEADRFLDPARDTAEQVESALQNSDLQDLGNQISTAEWLGPLAPIAISPFFGQAMLFGVASFGPDWLKERSNLISEKGPFNNPTLFFVFAILAVLTSLPRFTKVAKPFVLVADKLETYSSVVTLIALRLLAVPESGSSDVSIELAAGIPEISYDLLMCIAAAINIITINVVKYFIELMIFIIPIPLIDGLLEAANKTICAALMALYCFSPLLATILNLLLFAAAAFVAAKVVRRVRYYRFLVTRKLLGFIWPDHYGHKSGETIAFALSGFRSLPPYSRVVLTDMGQNRLLVEGRSLWRKEAVELKLRLDATEKLFFISMVRSIETDTGEQFRFGSANLVSPQTDPNTIVVDVV